MTRQTPPYGLHDTYMHGHRPAKLGICHHCGARTEAFPSAGYVQAAMGDHVCVGGELEVNA